MKYASPALIALLESSRQFVMWEEYRFLLIDGTILSYTTRDQDAVAARAQHWWFDSFDGTGNLTTHNAPVAGPYTGYSGTEADLGEFVLNGNGGGSLNPGFTLFPGPVDARPDPFGDYRMQYTVDFEAPTTDVVSTGLQQQTVGVGSWGVVVYAIPSDANLRIGISADLSPFPAPQDIGTNIPVDGVHVVRVDIDQNRTRLTVTIDDEQQAQLELDSMPLLQEIFLQPYTASVDDEPAVFLEVDCFMSNAPVALPGQPFFKRSNLRTVIGVEVDTLSINIDCNLGTLIDGMPLPQFVLRGGFDGARMTLLRHFAPDWNSASVGSLYLFSGRVADIDGSGTSISMQVKSNLELLNIRMPRNLYQAACVLTLYSANCGANAAAFTVTGNVGTGSTVTLVTTDLVAADAYFDLGVITFTSGDNEGTSRTVKAYAGGNVSVAYPLPYVPAPGDTFDIKPGCNKSHEACDITFNNTQNFRGFRFIPVPESTL